VLPAEESGELRRQLADRDRKIRRLELELSAMRREVSQMWAEVEARNYEIFTLHHRLSITSEPGEPASPAASNAQTATALDEWYEVDELLLEDEFQRETLPEGWPAALQAK
jgi:predicted RNase H-like nuclease (RuvC/YqgF family)